MSFDHLGLTPELLRAVAQQGYTEPTPVQHEASPMSSPAATCSPAPRRAPARRPPSCCPSCSGCTRRHVAGQRRAASACSSWRPRASSPPQVEESVRTYGKHRPHPSTVIYGGVGFEQQVRAPARRAPRSSSPRPGRLLDHVGQRTIDLCRVEILVLDEADRMLDMGFIHDIRRILALLPAERQNLLFSATFSAEIRRLAADFLRDPATVAGRAQEHRRRSSSSRSSIRSTTSRKRELLQPAGPEPPRSTRRSSSRAPSTAPTGSPSSWAATASAPSPSTATRASRSACARSTTSRQTRSRSSSPRTSPRAAWTSRPSPTSSTTSCPWCPTTTCTASGAPAGPAPTATRSRWSASTSDALLREIERLLGHPIQVEIIPGFAPDRRSARRPSSCGVARVADDRRADPRVDRRVYSQSRPRPTGAPAVHSGYAPAANQAGIGRWPGGTKFTPNRHARRNARRNFGRVRP